MLRQFARDGRPADLIAEPDEPAARRDDHRRPVRRAVRGAEQLERGIADVENHDFAVLSDRVAALGDAQRRGRALGIERDDGFARGGPLSKDGPREENRGQRQRRGADQVGCDAPHVTS